MKICCLSDLHGHLPEVPDCDLLLLGGDYVPIGCNSEYTWFVGHFNRWLSELSKRMKIIGVAGNHDFFFEKNPALYLPNLSWTYLQDSGTEFGPHKIWGSPWQRRFHDWAFNASEEELSTKWDLIPHYTDIFLLHGPPFGIGDLSPHGNEHVGSPSLLKKINEIKPKLVVFGHIHSGCGVYHVGSSILVNASHVNESYKPTNVPIVIDL